MDPITALGQKKQFSELTHAFNECDKNDSGFVQIADIGRVLKMLGILPTPYQTSELKKCLDRQGRGRFSLNEITGALVDRGFIAAEETAVTEEELRTMFEMFDKTGGGTIDNKDLRSLIPCLGDHITEDQIGEMISDLDLNGDGEISCEELLASMRREWQSNSEKQ